MNIRIILCPFIALLSIFLAGPIQAAETDLPQAELKKVKPISGKVIDAIKARDYVYIQLDDGKRKTWVATYAAIKVAVGDEVHVTDYMVMENFKSKTLDKTFDSVLFTSFVQVGSETNATQAVLPAGHPVLPQKRAPITEIEKGSVKKLKGGYTVEECFTKAEALKEKQIKMRGVVVKFTPGIMDRNWVHVKDGTGAAGQDDLTATTKEVAEVGDVVVITGKISFNKDFGAGYFYKAIIEEASITREGSYRP